MCVSPAPSVMHLTVIHPAFPAVLIALVVFGLGALIVRRSAFYRGLVDREVSANRFHAIDGLRGYLALGVVLHHVVINFQYYQTGVWELTPSRVNTFFGRGSVGFFFMITAFLFWNRAVNERGHIDALRFYVSRLRRMVPMYLFSAVLVVVVALALTHFRLQEPPLELLRHVMAWMFFTIPGPLNINGFGQTPLINTVFWSLVYEWKFYFLFPLLAVFARTKTQWSLAAVAALYIWLYSDTQIEWFFLGGCVAAVLTRVEMVRKLAAGWAGSAVALIGLGAALEWQPVVYSLAGAMLLLFPFAMFAGGNTLFGLLTCRPARLLGLLSYSVYLLHNLVLFLVSRLVNHFTEIAALSERSYWILGAVVAVLTASISACTYRWIEYPYLGTSSRTEPASGDRGRIAAS